MRSHRQPAWFRYRCASDAFLCAFLALTPLCAVVGMSAGAFARMWRLREPAIRRALASAASAYLKTDVRIRDLTVRRGAIEVSGVAVRDPGSGSLDGSGRSIIKAERLYVPLDKRTLTRVLSGDDPPFPWVLADGVRLHLTRDARGGWNVARLIPPSEGPPGRNWLGEIRLRNGSVELTDERLLRQMGGRPRRVQGSAHHIAGVVHFDRPGETLWSACGDLGGNLRGRLRSGGLYSSTANRLYGWVRFWRVEPPAWLSRVLPAGFAVSRGLADGVAVVVGPPSGKGAALRLTADARLTSVLGAVPWLRGPVAVSSGRVALRDGGLFGDLIGNAAGGHVRLEARVGLGGDVRYDARLRATGLSVGRVASALRATPASVRRIASAVRASGRASARLSGGAGGSHVQLSAFVEGEGAITPEARLGAGTALRVRVRGPLDRPMVSARMLAPRATVCGVPLLNGVAQVRWVSGRVWAEAGASAAGGSVYARGLMQAKEQPEYSATLSARNVSLAQARAAIGASQLLRHACGGLPNALGGRLSGDAVLSGRDGDWLQSGETLVQVYAPKYDSASAERAEVTARLEAGRLHILRATLEDGAAVAALHGQIELASGRADLDAACEGWPVQALGQFGSDGLGDALGGVISLRDGRIEGDIRQPILRGSLYGVGLRYAGWDADYATAYVEGRPGSLQVDGEVVRVPSAATFHGFVRRPFSGRPWVTLATSVTNVEVGEAVELSGGKFDISGLVSAEGVVSGSAGTLALKDLSVLAGRVWIGDTAVDRAEAKGSVDDLTGHPRMHIDGAEALVGGGHVRAGGWLTSDGSFSCDLAADDVGLPSLGGLWSAYADLGGCITGRAEVAGAPDRDGKLALSGQGTARTTGLTVNGESLGELEVGAQLADGVVSVCTAPSARLGDAASGITFPSATFSLDTRRLEARAVLTDLPVDLYRRAVARSPALLAAAAEGGAAPVLRALEPLGGSVRGAIGLRADIPAGTYDIAGGLDSSSLHVADVPITRFAASLRATQEEVTLNSVEAHAGDMTVVGSGALRYGESISGAVSADGVGLGLISQWLAPGSGFAGVEGAIDTITAEVGGRPQSPVVSLYAGARNLSLAGPKASEGAATHLFVPDARLSGVTIQDGEARFDDLALTIASAAHSVTSDVRPLELHASGRLGFEWKPPYIKEDEVAEVRLRLTNQPLSALKGLGGGAQVELDGSASADVHAQGTLAEFRRLVSGEATDPRALVITGDARVVADRIRALSMRTMLGDVDVRAKLADGRVELLPRAPGEPIARVMRLAANAASAPIPAGDIRVSGSIPIAGKGAPDDAIRITAQESKFDEAPLPGFASGRVTGEIASEGDAPGLRLNVSGSVMEPHISGRIELRRTSLRMPVTDPLASPAAPPGVIDPTFDVSLAVGEDVRIVNSQMIASVATASSQPIRLTGSLSKPKLTGALLIESGSLTFPTARFAIARGGRVDLRYPGTGHLRAEDAGLDVSLDVTATSRLTARSVTGATRRYRVTVAAKGPLMATSAAGTDASAGRLKLTYRAEPPDLALSQAGLAQRITAILGGQDAIEAAFSGGGRATSNVLIGHAFDYLGGALLPGLMDQMGIGRSLGLEEFTLDYSRAGAFVLRLSRNILGPIEASYWRRISGNRETVGDAGVWELKLGVRLRNQFRLSWSLDNQRTNAYLLEGVYSF